MNKVLRVFGVQYRRLWEFSTSNCSISITWRKKWLAAVFGLIFMWYVFDPVPASAGAMALVGGMIILSYFWARMMAATVIARRELKSGAFQVGDQLEEVAVLDNHSFLPVLWARYLDQSNMPGHNVSGIGGSEAASVGRWPVRTLCTRRGVFQLGPWRLMLGDPLDIFEVQQTYHQEKMIVVYPPLAELPDDLRPANRHTGSDRLLRQLLPAQTINSASTRNYVAGDSLRHVHWRTTARQGELHVRMFEPEAFSAVWIVLDLDNSVHYNPTQNEEDSTFETMITMAASMARNLLLKQFPVGLVACGFSGGPGLTPSDQLILHVPRRETSSLWRVLRVLAPLEPGSTPLASVLEQVEPLLTNRDQLLIITPSLKPDWAEALEKITNRRSQGRACTIYLLDLHTDVSFEASSRMSGDLRMKGMDTRIVRPGQIRPIHGAYGPINRWEFRVTPTGRAIAIRAPQREIQEGKKVSQSW